MDSYLKDAVVLVSPCLQRLGTQHDNTVGLSNVIGICGDHFYKWPKWQHVADKRGFCAQLVRKIQEKNCAHYMVLWRCLAYMPVYCLKLFMIYNIISEYIWYIYIYILLYINYRLTSAFQLTVSADHQGTGSWLIRKICPRWSWENQKFGAGQDVVLYSLGPLFYLDEWA